MATVYENPHPYPVIIDAPPSIGGSIKLRPMTAKDGCEAVPGYLANVYGKWFDRFVDKTGLRRRQVGSQNARRGTSSSIAQTKSDSAELLDMRSQLDAYISRYGSITADNGLVSLEAMSSNDAADEFEQFEDSNDEITELDLTVDNIASMSLDRVKEHLTKMGVVHKHSWKEGTLRQKLAEEAGIA